MFAYLFLTLLKGLFATSQEIFNSFGKCCQEKWLLFTIKNSGKYSLL